VRRSARPLVPTVVAALVAIVLIAGSGTAAAATRPHWMRRIDSLVHGHRVSVAVGADGRYVYRHRAKTLRTPASNEKLLLSMALFDALGPDATITTAVKSTSAPSNGVIVGNLWIIGRGNPEIGKPEMASLAKQVAAADITKIRGRVFGGTAYFSRDWWAPGWKPDFPADEIALPTSLTFRGNLGPSGGHISDPERRAAKWLTGRLRARGVTVTGKPGMGDPPSGLKPIAALTSDPLHEIVHRMDIDSINFDAEVLGKLLGAVVEGVPGSIAKCAAALKAFTSSHHVQVQAYDCSGLSYDDRVAPLGMVRLLWAADAAPWGPVLRSSLPHAGQGTLVDRLKGVRVRAKTGTLTSISALSGWVWLESRGAWGEFSILSRGMSKTKASRIEDAIVRTVSAHAG
jgi:serine-type D-Ala-D-Ala carboxypeptidase/endopeptidase (penicillin-binding protein 4)